MVFAASGLGGFGDDYFGEGLVMWVTGDNAGASHRIRSFVASGGVFALLVPVANNIQAGDTFSVIAGCRKRRSEDCRTKFNNVLNFQGEPDLPGGDAVLRLPGGGA